MQKIVDFELAVERIGFVLATVLFRDRLPDSFWDNANVEQCFKLMCDYPTHHWHGKGQDDSEEIAFRKEAYKNAQAKLLSIVSTSSSFEELEQAHTLSRGEVEWWVPESAISYYDFCVRVLDRMSRVERKATEHWKKIRHYTSSVLQTTWHNKHDRQGPHGVAKKALEDLRAKAATKIFESAKTAQDWYYLWPDNGTEHGESLSGRCLFGLSGIQRLEVIRQVVVHLGELFESEDGVQSCIWAISDLPPDAPERETALDYLESSNFFYKVGEFTDPKSERYQRVFARLEEADDFEGWHRGYVFTSSTCEFGKACLERAIKKAKTRKQMEEVISNVHRQYPRLPELRSKLSSMPPEPKKKTKTYRRSSEVATS